MYLLRMAACGAGRPLLLGACRFKPRSFLLTIRHGSLSIVSCFVPVAASYRRPRRSSYRRWLCQAPAGEKETSHVACVVLEYCSLCFCLASLGLRLPSKCPYHLDPNAMYLLVLKRCHAILSPWLQATGADCCRSKSGTGGWAMPSTLSLQAYYA